MKPQALAIVLGASRGLGLALCQQLAQRGHALLCFSRSALPPGLSARHCVLDLADTAASVARVQRALQDQDPARVGSLLCISNAALLGPVGPIGHGALDEKVQADQLRNLTVNLLSPVAVLTAIVQHWQTLAVPKRLAHIGSAVVQRPQPGLALYGAAKAGMQHFMQTLALEQNTQTHAFVPLSVDPGAMDTLMQAQLRSESALPARAAYAQRHAAGQLRDPVHVAAAIVDHLLSPHLEPGSAYRVPDSAL